MLAAMNNRQKGGTLGDVARDLLAAVREIERAAVRLARFDQVDAEGLSTQEADEAVDLREIAVQIEQVSAWAAAKSLRYLQAAGES